MGIIGRWIDALPEDRMRDHIIEHPDPTFNGSGRFYDPSRDCGCFVGCVALGEGCERGEYEVIGWLHEHLSSATNIPEGDGEPVYNLFPRLAYRVGPERAWALVKARAAKRNRITLPEPAPEKATA